MPRQEIAISRSPEGRSAGSVICVGQASGGISVQPYATATRRPAVNCITSHSSFPFQKRSRTIPTGPPTRRWYFTIRTARSIRGDACVINGAIYSITQGAYVGERDRQERHRALEAGSCRLREGGDWHQGDVPHRRSRDR